MTVQKTVTHSWGSRLGDSIKGVVAGVILFVVAFPVLWMNEGRSVKTYKALKEGAGAVVHVESSEINPENEGKLIHITNKADTADVLADGTFGISATAIKLQRKVEMYQWKEKSSTKKEKKLGGSEVETTTYTYEKGWSDSVIDSSGFQEEGHGNPTAMPYESEEMHAENVNCGAFRLTAEQIERIGGAVPLNPPAELELSIERCKKTASGFYISVNETSSEAQPAIGDVRVKFYVVKPHDISICAVQQGDTFVSYVAKNGNKVNLQEDGVKSADEMFTSAQNANKMLTWLLRIVGFAMMYIGIGMILKPLSVLGDVLPFLGNLIGMGASLVAFLVALPCSLLVIAIAWLAYRPVLAVILIAIVVGAVVAFKRLYAQAKAAKQGTEPSAA